MYEIFFNDSIIAKLNSEEHSLALAFNIHNSSNVEHSIKVVYCDDVIAVLIKRPKTADDSSADKLP